MRTPDIKKIMRGVEMAAKKKAVKKAPLEPHLCPETGEPHETIPLETMLEGQVFHWDPKRKRSVSKIMCVRCRKQGVSVIFDWSDDWSDS